MRGCSDGTRPKQVTHNSPELAVLLLLRLLGLRMRQQQAKVAPQLHVRIHLRNTSVNMTSTGHQAAITMDTMRHKGQELGHLCSNRQLVRSNACPARTAHQNKQAHSQIQPGLGESVEPASAAHACSVAGS